MSIIICLNCGAKNRVDESRASHDLAKCGKCGKPLPAATHGPVTITDQNFSSEVMAAGSTPVLVDCWAVWCPPCRAIAPIVDQFGTGNRIGGQGGRRIGGHLVS